MEFILTGWMIWINVLLEVEVKKSGNDEQGNGEIFVEE